MDGRTQEPVAAWIKARFGVDHVDTITEAGPNGVLARGEPEGTDAIRRRVAVSVNGHGSRVVVLVGHHDCAGNPGARPMQEEHTLRGLAVVESWGFPVRRLGVYVDEGWQVTPLFDSEGELAPERRQR